MGEAGCRIIISKEEARGFLVSYHNLNRIEAFEGMEGVLKCFNRIKSIQYDPLDVVGKNPDLVLQSRVAGYKPELLYDLLYRQHKLIDGFDKEMCIYAASEFTSFARVRAASGRSTMNALAYRGQLEALELLDEVRGFIKKNGITGSKDLSIGGGQTGRWGHKKLSSAALDYLYSIGELSVKEKRGVQKYYDFTENVVPKEYLQKEDFVSDDDFLDWYVGRRVRAVGLLWNKKGGAWQGHYLSDANARQKALKRLLEKSELKQVYVEGIDTPFYYPAESEGFFDLHTNKSHVRFLAPLDNFLWDREMTKRLFDFEYRWEVYTPASKRKYGYYVLPVLYGTSLVARFEPERSIKGEAFAIKHWWWEPSAVVTDELLEQVQQAIRDFAAYLSVPCKDSYIDVIMKQV